ncbi:probable bifunctional dTTP/UTP pyrophosphatase/methyltransferase protein [Phodopus roborovskii]|uniref:probable bifunctional dTTP/UTP pyrophosphatase/methyltransferase protein n=1 Tax=Phodopus roborovskii TaxID=109678 RepID=UPI0021E49A89|nr:probable bifunctional dTTP/UTP pyrophosphatase/methyltransferase protein [Phodopus roborovskii]
MLRRWWAGPLHGAPASAHPSPAPCQPRPVPPSLAPPRLSGQQHSVITGVAILRPLWQRQLQEPSSTCPEAPEAEGDPEAEVELSLFHEETRVTFSRLSEPLLCQYVESREPLDKAGAYGLQARGGALAERVEGDFFNTVGFPLNRCMRELAAIFPDVGPHVPVSQHPATPQ